MTCFCYMYRLLVLDVLVIKAMGAGKAAAKAIDEYIQNK